MAAASSSGDHASASGDEHIFTKWRGWERYQPADSWFWGKFVKSTDPSLWKKERHCVSYGRQGSAFGEPIGLAQQANLWLRRGDVSLESMRLKIYNHPAVIHSSIEVLSKSGRADSHESPFKYKFQTHFGFRLTIGLSRYKEKNIDQGRCRAWAAFGANCNDRYAHEVATDLLLAFCSHWPVFCHHQTNRTYVWKPVCKEGPPVPAPLSNKLPLMPPSPATPPPPARTPPPPAGEMASASGDSAALMPQPSSTPTAPTISSSLANPPPPAGTPPLESVEMASASRDSASGDVFPPEAETQEDIPLAPLQPLADIPHPLSSWIVQECNFF